MYKLIALIGKSGSGKNTLCSHLLHNVENLYGVPLHKVIPVTTRPKREEEKDGRDYLFYSTKYFIEAINQKRFAEATHFNGWSYGTLLSSLSPSKINIGIFNADGITCLCEILKEQLQIALIYIVAPPAVRLIRQLSRACNPDILEIFRRYVADEKDFLNFEIQNHVPYYVYDNTKNRPLDDFIKYIKNLSQIKEDIFIQNNIKKINNKE